MDLKEMVLNIYEELRSESENSLMKELRSENENSLKELSEKEKSLKDLILKNEPIFDRFLTEFVSQTPLHIAIQHESVYFAREILSRQPQLAHVLSSQGFSPLHMASAKGSAEIVKELLPLIADVSYDRDSKGWTPVHAAAMKGHIDVLKEFKRIKAEWIRDMTDRDETVLHLYVKYNNKVNKLTDLLALDDDREFVNRKDANGNTILHLAAMKKDMEMIRYLISTETGVEINATNMNGFTALDVFALRPSNSADKKMENELRKKGAENSLKTSTEKAAKEKAAKEIRNVLILVGTLTATLCFQAALVPPGGLWQDDSNMGFNNFTMGFNNRTMGFNNSSDNKNHTAGISILADKDPRGFVLFQSINYLLFFISFSLILRGTMSSIRDGFRWKLFVSECLIVIATFMLVIVMIYICNEVHTPEGFTHDIRGLHLIFPRIFPAAIMLVCYSYIILFSECFYRLVRRAVARIRGSNVDTGTQQRS